MEWRGASGKLNVVVGSGLHEEGEPTMGIRCDAAGAGAMKRWIHPNSTPLHMRRYCNQLRINSYSAHNLLPPPKEQRQLSMIVYRSSLSMMIASLVSPSAFADTFHALCLEERLWNPSPQPPHTSINPCPLKIPIQYRTPDSALTALRCSRTGHQNHPSPE